MTKIKLYNPEKNSIFKMQFGFEAPLNYMPNNRKKTKYEKYKNKVRGSKESI